MAEVSKTAKRSSGKVAVVKKRLCRQCGTGETTPVKFAGYGPKGMRWMCQGNDKNPSCGFTEPIR